MHAHHEHLLVVGAVEDADLAPRRQALGVAPQVVVVELLGRGHLEAVHRHALRVDAAHHVADRAVLAGGVERLQHDEHAPACPGRRGGPGSRSAAATPSSSSSTPCFFLCSPPVKAGSKSFASLTLRPGSTRKGSMNSARCARRRPLDWSAIYPAYARDRGFRAGCRPAASLHIVGFAQLLPGVCRASRTGLKRGRQT